MIAHAWIGAVLAGATLAASAAGSAGGGALERYRWRFRLVVIAADAADPRIAAQRRIVDDAKVAMRSRDVIVVEAVGETAEARAIRRALGLPEQGFRVVLVGKDGGAKLVEDGPLTAARLVETIDAMPMRRDEAKHR